MTNKDSGELFQTDDLKGIVIAWLQDSSSNPEDYLTREGMAYLNGFTQASNSISLIKKEKYDVLLNNYEELINKYEKLIKESEENSKIFSMCKEELEEQKLHAQTNSNTVNKLLEENKTLKEEKEYLRGEANKYRNLYEERPFVPVPSNNLI